MLVPNQPQADHSSAPPPYTSTTALPAERPSSFTIPALRGGDAHFPATAIEPRFSSAAVYFDDRPCTIPYPTHILNLTMSFSPRSTRDEFPFPQPGEQYQSRDVSIDDWNTFLNYLLPVDTDPANDKSRLSRSRSKDASRDRDRIEAVLAEWHEGFFGPRGIQIGARFPTASLLDTSPPPPFTSTVDVGYHPEAGRSADQKASIPRDSQMPTQPPMSYGQSSMQWARHNLVGTRLGSGPLGRLLSGNSIQNPSLQDDFQSRLERNRHGMRERRGRSPSSSSTSSSSSSSSSGIGFGGRGFHHRGGHHRGGHRGGRHHGRGRHHHRRRSSSSSSSSSSGSSVSFSSSDFSSVDADDVRRLFVAIRQNLNNKVYLMNAVRQFKNEIRQTKQQHRDASRGMRHMSKEQRKQLKGQAKGMKAELKSVVKEARAVRKADRKVWKAERKIQRAQHRAEKRGMNAHEMNNKAVLKAEAKALKAQMRAVEANKLVREKAMEGEERAKSQKERELQGLSRAETAEHEKEQDLMERTRSLGLHDNEKQASGTCAQNE
ncbi:MAG: hypothetical protein L6R41_000790 [Letrouitia leprolyta]|nr:MAG: hypothetical protein L6R41_000790 [Letrouitia leprolyta]